MISTQAVTSTSRVRRIRRLTGSPSVLIAILVLAIWAMASLGASWLAPYDSASQDLPHRLAPPSSTHWLGTDELGRDVLSRIVYGGRVSVPAGFAVVLASAIFGTLLGAVAGYWQRWLDDVLMRLTDFFFAFPPIILALAIGAAFGPALSRSLLALIIVWWPKYARMARGMVQVLKTREFVEAARAAGAGDARILRKAIMPNAIRPLLVMGILDIAAGVVAVAMFSFLGMGVRPPTAEWGAMIAEGASLIDKWWVSLFPGLAMLMVIVALNVTGEAVREAFAPEHP